MSCNCWSCYNSCSNINEKIKKREDELNPSGCCCRRPSAEDVLFSFLIDWIKMRRKMRKREKTIAKGLCPECYTPFKPSRSICTYCGHVLRTTETIVEKEEKYIRNLNLPVEIAKELVISPRADLFDELVKAGMEPKFVAVTLVQTIKALASDNVPIENLTDKRIKDIFEILKNKRITEEAIEPLLKHFAEKPRDKMDSALKQLGIELFSEEKLNKIIDKVFKENLDFIKEKGQRALEKLKGHVMDQVRGKIDGKIVNETLNKKFKAKLIELGLKKEDKESEIKKLVSNKQKTSLQWLSSVTMIPIESVIEILTKDPNFLIKDDYVVNQKLLVKSKSTMPKDGIVSAQELREKEEKITKRICPICNNPFEPSHEFCFNCGYVLK